MLKIKSGRHSLVISNPDKILFPKAKITKHQLVSYYAALADTMVVYAKNHLITMLRYPNGILEEGFYQKDAPDYFPPWIARKAVKTAEGKSVHYVVLNNAATVIYLANQGCLTPHIWLSTAKKIEYPDRLIIDLDPSGKKFDMSAVRATALVFRDILEKLGLIPFVMTTGSRGLHVVVPLAQKDTFDHVREFARLLCSHIAHASPKTLTLDMRKSARKGRIFLDYLRNSLSATAVAPYAVRAHEHAPVATPIDWDEIKDSRLVSTRYTIKTVARRLEKKGDPWSAFKKSKKSLTKAHKLLKKIVEE